MSDENQNNQSWGDPAAMRANAEFAKSFSTDMKDSALYTKGMADAMSKMAEKAGINDKTMASYLGAVQDITKEFRDHADLIEKINEGEVSLSDAKELQTKAQEKLDTLTTKSNKAKQAIAKAEKAGTLSTKKKNSLLKDILGTEKESLRLKENMSLATMQAAKGATAGSKAFGHMAATFGAMGWAKASGAAKAVAVGMRGAAIAGGGLALTIKWVSRALMKFALSNPYTAIALAILMALVAIKKFFSTLVAVNQEVTEIQRAFGVSKELATAIRKEYVHMAAAISQSGIEYKELLRAQGALQDSLGTSAKVIHQDILEGMAMMVERMHLSEQAAVAFGKAALANKQNVRDLTLQVMDNVLENQKNTGVMLQGKKIMEETAKVAGQLRGIYAANMDLISKSVIKAQMLGKSLGEVSKESKQMLDFQSSIEKEMEAELFLGKQLNLEKARLAALTGDYDTYMDEIVANAGDFHEFSKLNVMQQDKLAGALNMSSDALADMLLQRADLESLKEKAREEGREDLLRQYEQMSLNEEWAATVKKLKTMIINLVAGLEWLVGWIPGMMESVGDMSDSMMASHRAGTVEVVGEAESRDPMAYDKTERYDSLGRKIAEQYYPKDQHWFSGTIPDHSRNKKEDLKANINVTTRMSDMNYAGRTDIHTTRFSNQKRV